MRALVLVTTALAALALAPAALAHATLLRTSPADGAVLSRAPAEVRVTFDDVVLVAGGNEVVRNGGGSVLAGKPRVEGRKTLVLPLRRGLGRGDYSVRWRILSDDGHLEQSVLAFRIGLAGSAAPTSVLAAGGGTSAAAVVARWLFFAGLLVAGGAGLFLLVVGPRPVGRDEQLGTSTLLVAGLTAAFLGGAELLHETSGATATRFGAVMEVAVVVAAVGATLAAVARVRERLLVPAVLAAVVLLAAPSLAGHALDPGKPRALEVAADLLHVCAAAFWIGGVAELTLLLPRLGERVVRRFSALALPALALLAATGLVRALSELSSVSQIWTTGYGRALAAKTILFALLLLLGVRSRTLLSRLPALRLNVVAEAGLLGLVVVAVAVLTAGRPGRTVLAATRPAAPSTRGEEPGKQPPPPPPGAVVLGGRSRDLALGLAVVPGDPLELRLTALGREGGGEDDLSVRFALSGAAGTVTRIADSCGPGCYGAELPAPGRRPERVDVLIAGRPTARFALPRAWPPPSGAALVARATRTFRALRSVTYDERLGSGVGAPLLTRWTLAAPDRLTYAIRGGASAIVIGTRRWDREAPGKPWQRTTISPLAEPTPFWVGGPVANAHVLGSSGATTRVSFAVPKIPAFFTATVDRRTGRTLALDMVAAAHFMHHRYFGFDASVRIAPPR